MFNWNALAELDPLSTVLSDPAKKFGKRHPQEFFRTGDLEAVRVPAALGVSQDWLSKKAQLAPIVMNGISSKKIEAFVGSQGARVHALERYDPTEGEHHSYYYFIAKEPTRPE